MKALMVFFSPDLWPLSHALPWMELLPWGSLLKPGIWDLSSSSWSLCRPSAQGVPVLLISCPITLGMEKQAHVEFALLHRPWRWWLAWPCPWSMRGRKWPSECSSGYSSCIATHSGETVHIQNGSSLSLSHRECAVNKEPRVCHEFRFVASTGQPIPTKQSHPSHTLVLLTYPWG